MTVDIFPIKFTGKVSGWLPILAVSVIVIVLNFALFFLLAAVIAAGASFGLSL